MAQSGNCHPRRTCHNHACSMRSKACPWSAKVMAGHSRMAARPPCWQSMTAPSAASPMTLRHNATKIAPA
eukprot:3555191-Lingulodinium_polyedra.AAC.1